MRIRYFPAKLKHLAELDQINRASMPENYSADFWADLLAQHHSFVAIANAAVVGYIMIGITEGQLTVVSFAVDKQYRGKGIGKELIRMGMHHCAQLNKKNIYLSVRVSNSVARKIYSAFGFVEVRQLPDYYYAPDEDGIEMIAEL